jgi:hypothetical protein
MGLSTVVVSVLSHWAYGADAAVTDPEQAGVDYQVQGEYAGQLTNDEKWGARVIALGDGQFQLIGYRNGLPGEGWDGSTSDRVSGALTDGVARFTVEGAILEIKDGLLHVYDSSRSSLGALKKVHRESKTLGAKPPEGAIVLFDGTSADGWEDGKTVEGNLLGATNCSTKKTFGDHTLHIEFRTPFMPKSRGQGRGNSGVYIDSRYELQVLDSFGLEGKDNECGGIYSINAPKLNMCFPPLAWQTYDIDFSAARYDEQGKKIKNARATIRHNGVVIHDDLELTKGTPGRLPEGPEPAGLFLQDHGNPVVYRNVWVVEK